MKTLLKGENSTTWNTGGTINISSDVASFTFTASVASNWTCSPYDRNYTWMSTNYPDSKLATPDTVNQAVTAYPLV